MRKQTKLCFQLSVGFIKYLVLNHEGVVTLVGAGHKDLPLVPVVHRMNHNYCSLGPQELKLADLAVESLKIKYMDFIFFVHNMHNKGFRSYNKTVYKFNKDLKKRSYKQNKSNWN